MGKKAKKAAPKEIVIYYKELTRQYKPGRIAKVADMLLTTFEWESTPQGHKYWDGMHQAILQVYEQAKTEQESKK
jgi:hypothetical protein